MCTSDVADRGPTPQMHTLGLDAQDLYSNVSGQLLYANVLTILAFAAVDLIPPVEDLCQLYSKVLCAGNSLVVEGIADGDPVPFLVTVSL